MGKPCVKKSVKLKLFVQEFNNENFTSDGQILFCQACSKKVNDMKKFYVKQHIDTTSHKESVKRFKSKQEFIKKSIGKKSDFNYELCEALIAADIPFFKLKNEILKSFLQKWTKQNIPDNSTLHKNYLNDLCNNVIFKVREYLEDKYIWIAVDETTDSKGKYVVNIIGGSLEIENPKSFLLLNAFVERNNAVMINQQINNALQILWPSGIQYNKVFLLVTDAAKYMVKLGKDMKRMYPKLIHITCLTHALHNTSEVIRKSYPNVDKFISSAKKLFEKCPSRVATFKNYAPNLALPPKPVITRWGTWISAANYASTNFTIICEIFKKFDPEDAICGDDIQRCMKDSNLKLDLAYISANFSCLIEVIEEMQKRDLLLSESIEKIEKLLSDF
jgi:hypothetical protein